MKRWFPLAALALAGCSTTPEYDPAPSVRPGAYRASGSNPVWDLTIDRANLVYTDRTNRVRVTQPTPRGAMIAAGLPVRTPRIQVLITRMRCEDPLTRRVHPETVQVTVDGRRMQGCGGEAVTTSLANSRWVVEEVNGRLTGSGPRFSMQFTGDRMSARFGCNLVGGSYAVTSVTFSAGAQATTRMACPDMGFEQQALGVLSEPATLLWQSADQVTIGNGRGQIRLRRAF